MSASQFKTQHVNILLIIALAGIRQASRKHSAGEGDWSRELDDGKVIVIAAVVGVTDPLAGKNIITSKTSQYR